MPYTLWPKNRRTGIVPTSYAEKEKMVRQHGRTSEGSVFAYVGAVSAPFLFHSHALCPIQTPQVHMVGLHAHMLQLSAHTVNKLT